MTKPEVTPGKGNPNTPHGDLNDWEVSRESLERLHDLRRQLHDVKADSKRSADSLDLVLAEMRALNTRHERLIKAVEALGGKEVIVKTVEEFKQQMETEFDKLNEKVAQQTTVVGSVKTLIEGSVAQIAALKEALKDAQQSGGADVSVLESLVARAQAVEDGLTVNTDTLTESVIAGTPAENA